MTGRDDLVGSITGLIGFAAAEEQRLLAAAPAGETGDAARWAALPVVAHNTQFRAQQVDRLRAITAGRVPGEFAEIDHRSAEVYLSYAGQDAACVRADSWRVAGELIEALASVPAADLLDPERNPWLRGRQLWLQVVVRGFWHPAGHLADYYLAHGQPGRAAGLAAHGVTLAGYLQVPDAAQGMAWYNLACAQARAGLLDEAADAARHAAELNPDLRTKLGAEPDLTAVRAGGRLAAAMDADP